MSYVMSRTLNEVVCPRCGRVGRVVVVVYDVWGGLGSSVYVKHYDSKSKVSKTCSIGHLRISDVKVLDRVGDILCLVNSARLTGYSNIVISDGVIRVLYEGFSVVLSVDNGKLLNMNVEYGDMPEHVKPLAFHIASVLASCYKR